MTNNDILRSKLYTFFEAQLVEEMNEFPILEVPAQTELLTWQSERPFMPLVLEGTVQIKRQDETGSEIVYYPVHQFQCCILSITGALRRAWGEVTLLEPHQRAHVFTLVECRILAIPIAKANDWISKYNTWTKFVMELYQERLRDLIRQHEITTLQKNEIEKQQRQITDSIRYASRIQSAVLPPSWFLETTLPEHFIFYKPKAIVSGDYYWIKRLQSKIHDPNGTEDIIIIAVADCTGHGVPGAFMSMLGISFLNEIMTHYHPFLASKILELLREKITASLNQGQAGTMRDGMDIALCVVNFKTLELQFAGAFNPLYIVRDNELTQLNADRMPVGKYETDNMSFTNNLYQLKKDDMLYMFSDGYADQFGGDKNQKFMSKRFKELLADISPLSMQEQHTVLSDNHLEWKGAKDQIDDILVMGIRIQDPQNT